MWAKYKQQSGFTIVELLIAIVVIGILAAITIVAYNGIQVRAKNTMRSSEAHEWQKIVTSYASTYGSYGTSGDGNGYCLGEGFTDTTGDGIGDCWDAIGGGKKSVNAAYNTEMKKVATLPNFTRELIVGDPAPYQRVGPVIYVEGGVTKIIYWLEGTDRVCPSGSIRWNDNRSYACNILLPTTPPNVTSITSNIARLRVDLI
jgi:prepilin-type N-terminal cleavage/methylation domain-containing protein